MRYFSESINLLIISMINYYHQYDKCTYYVLVKIIFQYLAYLCDQKQHGRKRLGQKQKTYYRITIKTFSKHEKIRK